MGIENITASQVLRRFLALYGLRWVPVGLLIPSLVLLCLERGISVADVGVALSLRGFIWLFMDLPAGSLADTWGRRPVLLTAAAVTLMSHLALATIPTLSGLVIFSVLQGLYRGLDSGTLNAWYVDSMIALGKKDSIERGFRLSGAVLGWSICAGCLLSGVLVWWHPIPGVTALNQPVLLAVAINLIVLAASLRFIPETKLSSSQPFGRAIRSVPATLRDGLRLVRNSKILLGLVLVELLWGFGMVATETLVPLRLEEITSQSVAAVILSPVTAAGWGVSALGAAALPLLTRKFGRVGAAVTLKIVQGIAVIAMGLVAGPVGVVLGYLFSYIINGAATPLHNSMVHDAIEGPHRTTASSVNSTANQLANALGLIVLTQVVGWASSALAFIVAGVVLAAAAPLYLLSRSPKVPPGSGQKSNDKMKADEA
ncbi:MFS transporter [Psychromicrobium lacuslunae]|uniref:MFS transporter n=1 Tax=Psychromicrobium lacuslunae TaxID=1618207 RepID=UPI0005D403DB|nr:MFS transporter [Psychromicrobium lacuslunae]